MNFENIIKDVWFGREKLWKVFWIYSGIVATIFSILIDAIILSGLFTLAVMLFAFYSIFTIWVSKGIYTCRFNVKKPTALKANFAIVFAILNALWLVVSVFNFFQQIELFRKDPTILEKKIELLKQS